MLVLPMALIALYSVMEQGNSIISFSFTLEHYIKFFTDRDFLLILWRSLMIAVKTTVICLLLGYPGCVFYRKKQRKGTECIGFMYYTSNVDQYACENLCVDRNAQ